ncbi:type VI secretion protein [Escherichia coli]|nr:type VI secretion protein [Escherichia coli]
MSGAEDMSAYITLPLCRISDRHADGSLTLDDDFIPSCQNIQVSKKLRVYLKEVQGAIGGRASDLANRIGSPAQSGIADVAEFMMLQLLNRNQTRFTHRARRSQLHPEDFYLDLAGLLGELMTFTEPSRLPCPLDVYDHHDLTKTFKTLLPEVKRALHTVLSPKRSICRCICVTVSGRPISMTQNCCNLPPLCWPWRQTCRSIRSSVSLSSSRKFPRRKKSAIWSVCRSPAFHCAH